MAPSMPRVCFCAALLLMGLCAVAQQLAGTAETADANWLRLVDGSQYGAAWQQQDSYARSAVSEKNFIAAMRAVREPLGTLRSRELVSAEATHTLPGAPDGEYVVARYKTSFEDKANALETLAARRQPDGTWRVDGYHIR